MYRENMWVAFLRDKKVWECVPGFYADFSLRGCSYGMGFYSVRPSLMNRLRQMMDEQPKRFLTALQQASDAGFQVSGERYARPKSAGLTTCFWKPLRQNSCKTSKRSPSLVILWLYVVFFSLTAFVDQFDDTID